MGHVRDLPEKKIGVDIAHDFKPEYVVSKERQKKVDELKSLASKAKRIILATDPDREGEAISWHVAALINDGNKKKAKSNKLERITFHEITEHAIKEALEHPREIDMNLVDAQQARRILDRLVGYKLSPLLWRKVRKGLSAGRVQSVALRLIVEREREIEAFKAVEYWEIEAELKKQQGTSDKVQVNSFKAKLAGLVSGEIQGSEAQDAVAEEKENNSFKIKIEKIEINSKEKTEEILKNLENGEWKIAEVIKKEVKKNPYPPFMTSTLQQGAGNRFGWTAKRTMSIAQQLYEAGYITYHRTDSLNLSVEAVNGSRSFIEKNYGKNYLSDAPRVYKTKSKVAQEAHEAIRPAHFSDLEKMKEQIMGEMGREAMKLYDLIWKRMMASQMKETLYDQTTAEITVNKFLFRATGSRIKFDGWKRLYDYEKNENEEEAENSENILPELNKGETLHLEQLLPSQHFTEPPPRFTEAALVKALEEKGIGRPSTYAPIITTIQGRQYVEKLEKKFRPTALGIAVNDFLIRNFPEIFDYSFTASMEDELDQVANGELKWVPVLKEFYGPFEKKLAAVGETAERVKVEVEETDQICDLCGAPLVVRVGRYGKFLACSRFPECKFTKAFLQTTGITCPKCGGNVILRRTKKGKSFYGCSNYPNCDFASWTKPVVKAEGNEENAGEVKKTESDINGVKA